MREWVKEKEGWEGGVAAREKKRGGLGRGRRHLSHCYIFYKKSASLDYHPAIPGQFGWSWLAQFP